MAEFPEKKIREWALETAAAVLYPEESLRHERLAEAMVEAARRGWNAGIDGAARECVAVRYYAVVGGGMEQAQVAAYTKGRDGATRDVEEQIHQMRSEQKLEVGLGGPAPEKSRDVSGHS